MDIELNNRIQLPYDLQRFAKDGEGGEKTEPATTKKLDDARKDGKVVKSKELSSAFDLIVLFLVLKIFTSFLSQSFTEVFSTVYNRIPDLTAAGAKNPSGKEITSLVGWMLLDMLKMLAPFLAIGFLVALLVSIIQVGWKVSTKPLEPKFDKFNPISGFKRIFSKDSLFELVKSIIKIGLIGYLAYDSVRDHSSELFILYDIPLIQAIILCGNIIINTGLRIAIIYLFVGLADWIYQKHKFNEDMKMTKQEVKDEFKNTEGNPEIKGRQRQRMREASQRRMMQDVPKADVIITNPTHYAVALKYDAETAKAPMVVAKGENYLAQKIKEKAKESGIEIVENKPLARMLYANVDIGGEIPPELYQAVADILAVIYSKKNKF